MNGLLPNYCVILRFIVLIAIGYTKFFHKSGMKGVEQDYSKNKCISESGG